MMKSGAPPDILSPVLSPVPSVTYRIPWFHKQYEFLSFKNQQGILNDINEQDSFPDWQHKHMKKSGAPSDKLSPVPYGHL